MTRVLVFLAHLELTAALHLGAAGQWWAAHAAARLGKLSAKHSGG